MLVHMNFGNYLKKRFMCALRDMSGKYNKYGISFKAVIIKYFIQKNETRLRCQCAEEAKCNVHNLNESSPLSRIWVNCNLTFNTWYKSLCDKTNILG